MRIALSLALVLSVALACEAAPGAACLRVPGALAAGGLGPAAAWPRVTRHDGNVPGLPAGERVVAAFDVSAWPAGVRERAARGEAAAEVELVIPGVLPDGTAPAAARIAALREGTLEVPAGEATQGAVPVRAHVMDLRGEGDALVVPLPVAHAGSATTRLYVIDHSRSVEWSLAPRLTPDPLDSEPLGDRDPLVLVHGMSNTDLSGDDHDPVKTQIWDALRAAPGYRELFATLKPYRYEYPTYRSVKDNGEALAELIRETAGEAGLRRGRVVLLGHSMGGLVIRHAMAHRGLGDHVRLAITAATPHHGAGGASLMYANWRIAERIGIFWTTVLRFAQSQSPDSPGQRSVAWDNHDGLITPGDAARYGLLVNDGLAGFNRTSAYTDRLTCVTGDVDSLWVTTDPTRILYDIVRRGQGAYHSTWGTSDPLVCRDSGIFAGAQIQGATLLPGLDHAQVATSPAAVQALLRMLRARPLP